MRNLRFKEHVIDAANRYPAWPFEIRRFVFQADTPSMIRGVRAIKGVSEDREEFSGRARERSHVRVNKFLRAAWA
jgi:hypothetical protein